MIFSGEDKIKLISNVLVIVYCSDCNKWIVNKLGIYIVL